MIADKKAKEWGEVVTVLAEYINTVRHVPDELRKAKRAFIFAAQQYNHLVIYQQQKPIYI